MPAGLPRVSERKELKVATENVGRADCAIFGNRQGVETESAEWLITQCYHPGRVSLVEFINEWGLAVRRDARDVVTKCPVDGRQ